MKTSEQLKISRILHAGYLFECGDTKIAFDPIFETPFSQNCYSFPEVTFDYLKIKNLKLDAIFISHYHDDHLSFESLSYLDRNTPIYIYCIFDELLSMLGDLGFKKIHSVNLNESVVVGGFEIIPRPALDIDVDSIFQIKVAGLNILNVVDSWIDWDTLDLLKTMKPWDLILWPFQTMAELEVLSPLRAKPLDQNLPIEWIEQLKELNPKYIVPSSCQFIFEPWSWYNHLYFPISYKGFNEQISKILPDTEVVKLDPSQAITMDVSGVHNAAPLDWVHLIGNPSSDYYYDPNFPAPTTAEISVKFQALTDEQVERVLTYCKSTIIEKFNALPTSEESFFNKKRYWMLSIYDHRGESTNFYYEVHNNNMKLVEEKAVISWVTEVPMARLYGALEDGESLSSMYVRINDTHFDSDIEAEISTADIMEDPLVRCLFTGEIGSYQKAQLAKIKKRYL